MTVQPHAIQQKLLALREDYVSSLPGKISEVDTLWDTLTRQWQHNTLATLQRHAHSLAGSGATFGFSDISGTARALDNVLKELTQTDEAPAAQLRDTIAASISALKQACNTAGSDRRSPPDELYRFATTAKVRDDNAVLLINVGATTAAPDAEQLQQYHYQLTACQLQGPEAVPAVMGLIEQHNPAALIYDIDEYSSENTALIDAVNRQLETDLPKVFISNRSGITPRLQAVRHGSDAYFVKPVEIAALVDKFDGYGRSQNAEPYGVMIIDDCASVANAYAIFLELAGIKTRVVTDPMQVCDALSEFNPDLVLLDMYMPNCFGPDLAMVIRQQGTYTSVPIVFLSAEVDITKQLTAMRRGGDDFLTKPIRPDHLVNAVKIRARRYRDLRAVMFRDNLSGLLNHSKIAEQLHIEISRAERHHEHLAYVMLDLDHFKNVNDSYGHAAGDQVIRSLARLLQHSVRNTDIVGRYGGEEFAIILYGTDWESAFDVMENLRKDFEKMEHVFNNQTVKITFSCGIAVYPDIRHSDVLQQEADNALYLAKNQGRNRTVLALPSSEN